MIRYRSEIYGFFKKNSIFYFFKIPYDIIFMRPSDPKKIGFVYSNSLFRVLRNKSAKLVFLEKNWMWELTQIHNFTVKTWVGTTSIL
ncbi:hypothetical protein LEP1GSC021_2733 [Leptospira noguchii str. 1993005606]|uniref:Uncharacterized protein n=2 Tax=Leptospira noguchii TaxID=28182 RepID=M6YET3_9LEPT|nr:hypothetical protein LEP1GSC035_2267 [Leptospira noguchii str. 2007001578]EMO88124.1 hypothetical protein LEP1GSC024_3904 [Leptospira noguchii str. 2001034031]EPE83649.1 hypothetical protein LEP1GSC021_2733 [Leptospira noguchii str. 1993005606]